MSQRYSSMKVGERLADHLSRDMPVGLSFSKNDRIPEGIELFVSYEAAKSRIEGLLLDSDTTGFWVGVYGDSESALTESESEMLLFLRQLNEKTNFGAVKAQRVNNVVWDLAL